MEQKPSQPITPFDHLVVPPHLQMMKLLLPYLSQSSQRFFAVFIKFSELQHTIRFFENSPFALHTQAFDKKISSPFDIVEDLLPYLDKEQAEMLKNMQNAMQMAEMFQTFSDMQSPPGSAAGDGFSPENLMKGMFSPEQQEMFDFYSNMFSQNAETAYDNNETDFNKEDFHGKLDESPGTEQSRSDETGAFENGLSANLGQEWEGPGSDPDGADHQRE